MGTFKILFFDWFEYVTKPNLKTLEEPLTPVIDEESKPPVQKRPEPTTADKSWLADNDEWFNKPGYEEMTGFAYGIHEKLIKANIHPA